MSAQSSDDKKSMIGPKSCDACRKRKIRCDRETPCSSCVAAGIECIVGLKRHIREPRSRILLSGEYEQKVDAMESRLSNIETLLKELVASKGRPEAAPTSVTAMSRFGTPFEGSSPMEKLHSTNGESLLCIQATDTGDFLENLVTSRGLKDVSFVNHPSVLNLKWLIETELKRLSSAQDELHFPLQDSSSRGESEPNAMPPTSLITLALQFAEAGRCDLFTCNVIKSGIQDFFTIYRDYSSAPSTSSVADSTIVNAGLYYLFTELSHDEASDPTKLGDYKRAAHLCESNLQRLLWSWSDSMPPDLRNIQALVLSVTYAIDSCWPSVAWRLNSIAVNMFEKGLYHRRRKNGGTDPQAQTSTILCWHIYTIEKSLSLRLGCASKIHEWEIIQDFLAVPALGDGTFLDQLSLPRTWVMTSTLRARVHEQLYSREARHSSSRDRIQRATALAEEFQALEKEMVAARDHAAAFFQSSTSPLVRLFSMSSFIQLSSLATLIYRILPGQGSSQTYDSPSSTKCIRYARQAIQHHFKSEATLGTSLALRKIYVHWTLMLTPFAPIFVLFRHTLETLDASDFQTIQNFSLTLRKMCGVSETAGRLYLLTQAMCDVLQAYFDRPYYWSQDTAPDFGPMFSSEVTSDFFADQMNSTQPSRMDDLYFGNIPFFP